MVDQRPKYERISELLLARIESGEWSPGVQIPSEPTIAEEYGAAYLTVRNAVRKLVDSGRLRRIRGRGTFVTEPPDPDRRPALGLLLTPKWHSLDPFYFPGIVSGFVSEAEEAGFTVHLADRTEPLLEFLTFRELQVGAVACVLLDHADLLDADALLDKGVSVVAINHYGGARKVASVSPDNRGGAFAATRHLLELGHRSFAFLAGPRSNFDATERRRGVKKALTDFGLGDQALRVYEGGFLEDSGYERGLLISRLKQPPTAVICVSDLAAIGLLKAFHESGVRVPEDVSVFGFGNFRLSGYTVPPLSTVELPLEELGRASARTLMERIKGFVSPPKVIECPLILRESVTTPRA